MINKAMQSCLFKTRKSLIGSCLYVVNGFCCYVHETYKSLSLQVVSILLVFIDFYQILSFATCVLNWRKLTNLQIYRDGHTHLLYIRKSSWLQRIVNPKNIKRKEWKVFLSLVLTLEFLQETWSSLFLVKSFGKRILWYLYEGTLGRGF